MKKRVLINGRFSSHHFAIRNVIYNVTDQISKNPEFETYITINYDSDYEDFKKLPVEIILNTNPADSGMKNHLFTIFELPSILKKYQIDLVVFPQICFFYNNPCQTLLYMHDLIEYKIESQNWKKMLFRKITYPLICKKADKIIAVSDNTKKDLMEILKVPNEKVDVAYDGADSSLVPLSKVDSRKEMLSKYSIKKYILYIGYLTHPQKNLLYLISEFKKFFERHPDYMLVFAGPKGKDADLILDFADKSGIPFQYLGKVPYEDLATLYSGCEFFCFPSKYEGFGMPVLEAMQCGCPVITSNVSSIPEILDDKRWLIDPNSEGMLADKMEEIINENPDQIIARNIKRAKLFTWDKHGEKLRSVISKMK